MARLRRWAVGGQQLTDRRRGHAGLVLQALLHLQKLGGVLQAHADISAYQAEGCREQKRQPPAPAVQVFAAKHLMQHRHERRAEQQPRRRTGRHDAGIQPAPALRCVLSQKRRRPRILARGRKALYQADQQQQARRPHADLRVAGQQPDAEGRNRHDQDRQRQRVAPPVAVAEMAPDHTAQGANEKRQGKHREGCQQTAGLVGLREKRSGNDGCKVAVGGVIEPFDEVAHETGARGLAQGLAFGAGRGAVESGSVQGGAGHDGYPLILLIGGRV